MKHRKLIAALMLAAAAAAGGFQAWRWFTTPAVHQFHLDGSDPRVIQAIEQAREEVVRQPRNGKAWGKLAMVLSVNGYLEPAQDCYTNARRFDEQNPTWPYLQGAQLLAREPQKGIPLLRQALSTARKTEERATILFRLALVLIDEGQLDDAAQYLQELQDLEPDGAQVHYLLGLHAAARNDRAAAREHFLRIAAHPLFRKRVCILLATLSDDRELSSKYRAASERYPSDLPWPDIFEGEKAQYKVNRLARIEEYMELDRQGQQKDAIASLRRFIAESPDGEVYLVLGFALYKMNEYSEAAAAFRAVLEYDPRSGLAQYHLASSLLLEGERLLQESRSSEAMDLFRQSIVAADRAIALETHIGDAYTVRGLALKHLGRTSEAIQSFREAKVSLPNSTKVLVNLGEALAEQGEYREAQIHLEDAVRLAAPGDTRPRASLEKWKSKFKE